MTTETKTYPPLTAEEFDAGCGFTFTGDGRESSRFGVCENENGDYVFGWGHIDRAIFAEAVNAHDEELAGWIEQPYTATDVEHRWAITVQPPDGPDGWWLQWGDVTKDTDQAFPITVVSR